MKLHYTTKQMEGIYKCTAENEANPTSSSAFLHVFGKDRTEHTVVYFKKDHRSY